MAKIIKKILVQLFFNPLLHGGFGYPNIRMSTVQVRHFDACTIGSISEEEEEEKRWNEDPFSGRLSVVDSAFSTLPPHLIDKHWNWVTILDLSRNHIE